MLLKAEAGRKTGGDPVNEKFLTEIETISKTLYIARSTSYDSITTASSQSNSTRKARLLDRKSSNENTSRKDKDKKSTWIWRPLKAFSNSRNQRFNCCFSLVVLSIEELSSTFDDTTLCVYWKRKDDILMTHPAKIVHGRAEFGDKLTYTCSVYGNKSGPHKSAKYEAKHFLLYASILDAPEVDLGKHRLDLTKLLPLTLEELKEEKSSGKWTTSYRLSGMARGAVMNVSFEYSTRATQDSQNNVKKLEMKPSLAEQNIGMKRVESLPSILNNILSRSVDEVKDLHEILSTSSSEPASSIDALFQNFVEEKTCSPLHDKPKLNDSAKNFEPIKPDTYPISDCGKENERENSEENMFSVVHDKPDIPNICFSQAVDEVEEKTCNPMNDKPELDDMAKTLEPIKPNTYPISDCGKENERENSEENMFSAVYDKPDIPNIFFSQAVDEVKDLHEVLPTSSSEVASSIDAVFRNSDEEKTSSHKPELDDIAKNLMPIKQDSCPISDCGKENGCQNNEENMFSLVHDKPDIDVSTENVKSIKPDPYSLSDSGKENTEERAADKFCVTEQGMESTSDSPDASAVDWTCILDTDGIQILFDDRVKHDSLDKGSDSSEEKAVVHERDYEEDDLYTQELLMKELEITLDKVSDLETLAPASPEGENYREAKSEYKMRKSHSLNDVTESVATEFLSMLGIDQSPNSLSSESEPESPRECLLRQFEEEALAKCFSIFSLDMDDEDEAEGRHNASVGSGLLDLTEGLKSSTQLQDVQEGLPVEAQEVMSKQRPMNLEDLETEAFTCVWSLNEKVFEHSPPKNSSDFGSPIDLPPEKPLGLPSLTERLYPFIQTKNREFLRSMNLSLFRNAKSGRSLIIQVSKPVVLSAAGIIGILQPLASVGNENLSMHTQANKLMPLEDITGKDMHQLGWEALSALEVVERFVLTVCITDLEFKFLEGIPLDVSLIEFKFVECRQCLLQNDVAIEQDSTCLQRGLKGTPPGQKSNKFSSSTVGVHTGSEFVSVEDPAPLAMEKIEVLSIEGLRIQSRMSCEDAPQFIDDISDSQGEEINTNSSLLVLKRAAGLQLLNLKDGSKDVKIMGLSMTLDEWNRMDAGEIDDKDIISEHTFKILAVHQANSFDLIHGSSKGERKRNKGPGRNCGLWGNNFTVALMMPLCDPLRYYEPIGMPMLTLVQDERVHTLPKPNIHGVFEVRDSSYGDDKSEHSYQKPSFDASTMFWYLCFLYPYYHLKCLFRNKLYEKVAYSFPLPLPRSHAYAFETITKVEMKVDKKEERGSEEEGIPRFRISEVHFAGLKTDTPKNKLGGISSRQQSGPRWLLANGMGKSNKHPLLRSKAASKFGAPGDTLRSVSSRVHGATGNSNVIISNVIKRFWRWRAE